MQRGVVQGLKGLLFGIALAMLSAVILDTVQPESAAAVNPPTLMNFQGRLTNSAGNVVSNGSYNMIFRIYDAASGGTLLWTETRDDVNRVTVTNGLFSVKLGEVTALSASTFANNASLYFEIQLANPATATCSFSGCATYETPMTPRSQLAASAYAFNATNAEAASNASNLGGVAAANYARLDIANSFTGANTFNSTILNSVDNSSALLVQNTSAVPFLKVDTSSATGTVRIGSTTSDANAIQLVLDTSTTDPAGNDGGMYYNGSRNTFRCFIDTWWQDCGPQIKKITSNVSTTSTTFQNATELSFAMLANTDYALRCDILYQSALGANGIRIGLNGPGTPNAVSGIFTSATSATGGISRFFSAYSSGSATSGVPASNTPTYGQLSATIRNGTTAGTLQVIYNSQNAGTSVTLLQGSSCQLISL